MAPKRGLYNKTRERPVVAKVDLATTFFKRLKGLLGTKSLEEDHGLFLSPCKSIHMFGMKYAIDAVFLNKDLIVVELVENIQPGAVSGHYRDALSCLELAQGTIKRVNLEIGDQLCWSDGDLTPARNRLRNDLGQNWTFEEKTGDLVLSSKFS